MPEPNQTTATDEATATATVEPEINHSVFISSMVNSFYAYMYDVYMEYSAMVNKPLANTTPKKNKYQQHKAANNNTKPPAIEIINLDDDTAIDNAISKADQKEQSFSEYFLFKLFYNYGIKRKMLNESIALLFYDKSLKGYKSDALITMLCRHLIINIANMRILSLGIPKSMKLDEFIGLYNINILDGENVSRDMQTPIENHRIYKFPEGTMITYNPSMRNYNIDVLRDNQHVDEDETVGGTVADSDKGNDPVNINDQIEKKFNEEFLPQFQYSTRKVIGTSKFNTSKTFLEMFNENNEIANTHLENIPIELMKNRVLVFNIEHPENKFISPITRNYNTLCAVYEFKDEEIATQQWNEIIHMDTNPESIYAAFMRLANDMIKQIPVSVFNDLVAPYNINLHLPEVIKMIEKKNPDGTVEKQPATIFKLIDIIKYRPKTFQGYIIYGINGERTKIMNPQYKLLRQLKGNRPITLNQWNIKNLFYLYWRLIKEKQIYNFIQEFDVGNTNYTYHNLFTWFSNLVKSFTLTLFRSYHHSFVKRDMDKHTIPYTMKPLCGDLHTSYKLNKIPINYNMVEKYIYDQPVSKIFWRLFSLPSVQQQQPQPQSQSQPQPQPQPLPDPPQQFQ